MIIPTRQLSPTIIQADDFAQAETPVLTIQGESTALARRPLPTLTISETELSFGQTAPGQPTSRIVSVRQQYSDELVTLTSDAPEHFLLATDKHPTFTASLRVEPSPIGTYVHVRYLPQKPGTHSGQLLIQSAFDERILPLTGRASRLLPTVRKTKPLNGYAQLERRTPATWLKVSAAVASLSVIAGLAWFGLAHRQTFPAGANTTEPTRHDVGSEKTATIPPIARTSKLLDKTAPASVQRQKDSKGKQEGPSVVASRKPSVESVGINHVASTSKAAKTETRAIEQLPKERKEPGTKPTESLVAKPPYRPARPVPATSESELEKELNQLTPNQP